MDEDFEIDWEYFYKCMKNAKPHEVKLPPGCKAMPEGEVEIQYRDGEFWYVPRES